MPFVPIVPFVVKTATIEDTKDTERLVLFVKFVVDKKPLFILADQERQQHFKYLISYDSFSNYFAKVQ